MMKALFNRFFFRGEFARSALRSITARLDRLELRLARLEELLRTSQPAQDQSVDKATLQAVQASLTDSIREVIAALETERAYVRELQDQMVDLTLSHPDGTHREVYRELDQIRTLLANDSESQKPNESFVE